MPPTEDLPYLVILVGPTASGKSGVALRCAESLGGEIVSADSVQVYRYMDIGAAKPPMEVRRKIRHHLIDVVDPDEDFSAARFRQEAGRAIREIHDRGKVPLVVGGTGLYIKALTQGLFKGPRGDPDLRRTLKLEAEIRGVGTLHGKLERVDPMAAERIHPHDLFRITRALEVFYLTGIPISRHQELHGFSRWLCRPLYFGLAVDRSVLYKKINARAEEMLERGLVKEVEDLLNRGYGLDLRSMRAIGYRHIGDYLLGACSLDEAIASMKRETRHYARRQMTWFRRIPSVRWFDPRQADEITEDVRRLVSEPLQ
jgi:tRNA dimethylallyltransferase